MDISKKALGTFAATVCLYSALNGSIAMAEPMNQGIVTIDNLNVRAQNNTSSNIIGSLNSNTKVDIFEVKNNWYKIKYKGNYGWIFGDYVKLNSTGSQNNSGQTAIVSVSSLNLRSGAGTNYGIIKTLSQNTRVTVLENGNGWSKVNANGSIGYVFSEYLSMNSSGNTNETVNESGFVNCSVLNLRNGAGVNYNVIKVLYQNTKVNILEKSNGWYKVNVDGQIGFVSSDYITIGQPIAPPSGNENNNSSNNINKRGVVNIDGLFVRTGPSTGYNHIGLLRYNNKVDIVGESNGWYKIKYNNDYGYVCKDYITIGENIPEEDTNSNIDILNKVAVINTSVLNVRSNPGTNSKIVGVLRYGNKANIKGHSNGWYKISSGSVQGWVCGDYIKIYNENEVPGAVVKETPLIESRYTGNDIVNKTMEYLGVPYLWGGFTPLGFDCSGLVQYIYKYYGISISRTTYYQVNEGKIINRNELRPGDLIFFTTDDSDPSSVSHVGIYKGDNQFIHAPGPNDVVRVSSLSNEYYSSHYYIAKRIIK